MQVTPYMGITSQLLAQRKSSGMKMALHCANVADMRIYVDTNIVSQRNVQHRIGCRLATFVLNHTSCIRQRLQPSLPYMEIH